MAYQNYVFDMGKVLIDYDIDNVIKEYTNDSKIIREVELITFLSGEWIQLDAGLMSEEEGLNDMLRHASSDEVREIAKKSFWDWHKYNMRPKEGMAELLQDLKEKGKKLYVLSNASIRLEECYKDYIPRSDLFDGVLFSASVKYIKPQQKIYEIFFDEFNLKPEECYFIDDRKDNIIGSKVVGMDGYVFDGNVSKLKEEIYKNEGWTF
jgi:putative hydrolase of the HAD superfamily